jgi:hypothetical protein
MRQLAGDTYIVGGTATEPHRHPWPASSAAGVGVRRVHAVPSYSVLALARARDAYKRPCAPFYLATDSIAASRRSAASGGANEDSRDHGKRGIGRDDAQFEVATRSVVGVTAKLRFATCPPGTGWVTA